MPLNRQQRGVLRGIVYTLVFISFTVSTFFFVRTLYRNHKADLKTRHTRLHTGMTEADVRRDFGPPYWESEFPYSQVNEREVGQPIPPSGVQLKCWRLDRNNTFTVYLSGHGEVLRVCGTTPSGEWTWIERRIDELLK